MLSLENERPSPSAWGIVARLSVVAAIVMLTFPICFGRSLGGQEGSWPMGLNAAFDQHLVHGRDIAFTYGPLGFALVPLDFGRSIWHATVLRVGLHVLWWASIALLLFRIPGRSSRLLFAAAALLSGMRFDAVYDANDVLTGVTVLTAVGYLVLAYIDRRPIWALPAMPVSVAALLAKFSLGMACTAAVGVWAVLELIRDRRRPVRLWLYGLALVYLASLLILFRIYSGPISALPDFIRLSLRMGSSYSSQMSGQIHGSHEWAIIAGLVLAVIVAGVGAIRRSSYAPFALIGLVPLFVLFKGAIVRADWMHYAMSCPPMVGIVAFLLAARAGRRGTIAIQAYVLLFLVACLWLSPPKDPRFYRKGAENIAALWNHRAVRAELRSKDMKQVFTLPQNLRAAIGQATVDVYPFTTCYAFYNDLNWKPRPIFHSYATYDPALDRRCADFYAGPNAPRFVLYSYESIDTEHPCIVDPLTWTEILRWYDLADRAGGVLLLSRRSAPRWTDVRKRGWQSLAFGERWEVPAADRGPLLLRAALRLTPSGRLSNLLYKVYPPLLRIEYADGTTAEHLLVWRNLESGFVVSDLPRGLDEVARFLGQDRVGRVRAVTFVDPSGAFAPTFSVAWSEIPMPAAPVAAIEAGLRK